MRSHFFIALPPSKESAACLVNIIRASADSASKADVADAKKAHDGGGSEVSGRQKPEEHEEMKEASKWKDGVGVVGRRGGGDGEGGRRRRWRRRRGGERGGGLSFSGGVRTGGERGGAGGGGVSRRIPR
eukprot:8080469-Pyramimonas_sp.AAC.1